MFDLEVLVASALIMMVFSFLYRDNIIFRVVEGGFVGASVARIVVVNMDTLRRTVLAPALKGNYFWFISVVIGLLYVTMFLKGSTRWMYRIPISFVLGSGLGLALAGLMKVSLSDQIIATASISLTGVPIADMLSNLIVIIATASMTFVFFFTRPSEGVLKYVMLIGRVFLMTYLGFQFAGTIMMRESVLIKELTYILTGDGIWLIPVAFALLGIAVYNDYKKGELQWMG